jgi:ATP-dependent Clp protease adapter protein ClpS
MNIRELISIVEAGEADVIDRPPVHHRPPEQQRQEVPVHLPGGWTVVILNDPVTPFEVVIEAIVAATRLSPDEAVRRMHKAHTQGWAAIASYASKDMAETIADRIMRHAQQNDRYDKYRPHIPYNDPWPLSAEVIEAGDGNGNN